MSSQAELGIRAFQEGRFAEAIIFLEFAAKFDPDNYPVWLMLARAYNQGGQAQKAAETFKLVLDSCADPQILAKAREGIGSIEDQGALASVQSEGILTSCPECGVAIADSRLDRPWCSCGWNSKVQAPVANRIFVHDIQAYCRRGSVRIGVIFHGDVIVISASEVCIQGIGTRTYPVNARLLFSTTHGMLTIERTELDKVMPKVNEEALFRERNAGDDMTMGKFYSWSQFLARISGFRGYDVSARPPDKSLASVLASFNALDQELIKDAIELREPSETLGQTILRLGISNFEAMVSAVVGDFRITKPGARPLSERLGTLMAAKDLINPDRLQEALALQPELGLPLGEILAQHLHACEPSDVQLAVKAQRAFMPVLPEADMLGELLVARKKITRTDMLQALADEQTKRRVPLGEVLVNMGLITTRDLQSVLTWQSQKKRLTQLGVVRLGEILVNQGVITHDQLGETLMMQVVDPRPIGQLLIAYGICPPEPILHALETQINRRNQMAGAEGSDALAEATAGAKRTAGGARTVASKSLKTSQAAPKKRGGQGAPAPRKKPSRRKSAAASKPPGWAWGALAVLILAMGGIGYMLMPHAHVAPTAVQRSK